jgi:hypothetical protein
MVMGKRAVLVMALAACLAFTSLDWTRVGTSVPGCVSISVKAGLIGRTVWQPVHAISIEDIIEWIIRSLGQLIDR